MSSWQRFVGNDYIGGQAAQAVVGTYCWADLPVDQAVGGWMIT
jgi:hypothetical protein